MANETPAPTQIVIRKPLVLEAIDAIVQGLGEMSMNPAEGLMAAELALWTLMENGMKLSPSAEILQQSKYAAARVVARLSARIEAWPAKTTERM